jgi:hypothetical protein
MKLTYIGLRNKEKIMAIVVYPDTGWNSYASLADAEIIVTNNVINPASWNALSDAQKELYLRQSTTLIRLKITDPATDEAPDDLQLATVLLSVDSIGKDMNDSDGKENLKRIKIEGAIEKEFFTKGDSSNKFPDIVESLLVQFVYKSSSSFTLMRA